MATLSFPAYALTEFTVNYSKLAEQGRIDPLIGRNEEINRMMQVLCRRTKNNPVLIGEAGVGKTAIVEGLAQRIIAGDIPELLRDRRMVVLDLALMVAGTMGVSWTFIVRSPPPGISTGTVSVS